MNPTIRSKIIFGIASTLKQLHKRKIILRNLKMENIVLDDNLEPKIKTCILSQFFSNPEKIKNEVSYEYLAPELLEYSNENCSFASDVYAYGIFLYHMITKDVRLTFVQNIDEDKKTGKCSHSHKKASKSDNNHRRSSSYHSSKKKTKNKL